MTEKDRLFRSLRVFVTIASVALGTLFVLAVLEYFGI